MKEFEQGHHEDIGFFSSSMPSLRASFARNASHFGRRKAIFGLTSLATASLLEQGQPASARLLSPNPLATSDQWHIDEQLLWALNRPEIIAAREKARALMLADPIAKTAASFLLDNALDKWINERIQSGFNMDVERPKINWTSQISSYSLGGRHFPGTTLFIDNPDCVYRGIPIDGGKNYVLTGTAQSPSAAQLTFQIAGMPSGKEGFALHQGHTKTDLAALATISDKDLVWDADGRFTLSFGPGPKQANTNHCVTPPGTLLLLVRDLLNDWRQRPYALSIQRAGWTPQKQKLDDYEIVRRAAEDIPDYVAFWLHYKNQFWTKAPANAAIGPSSRSGGWGTGASARFSLEADQALLITVKHTNAVYSGVQVTDSWGVSPDPTQVQCSLNGSQSTRNAKGDYDYVVSLHDPGAPNWLSTNGQTGGFIYFRWSGTFADPGSILSRFDVVKINDLASQIDLRTRINPSQRTALLEQRKADWNLRVS